MYKKVQYAVLHSFKPTTTALRATVKGYETFRPRVVWPAAIGFLVIPVRDIAWLVDPLPLFNNNKQGVQHLPGPEYPHFVLRAILFKPRPHPDIP